jgi:hypothetical protein
MKRLIPIILLSTSAHAGPYVELGIGSTFGKCDCARLENPVGVVAAGYNFQNGLRLDVEHRSSLVTTDYGSNLISIRYRYDFKTPNRAGSQQQR